MFVELLSVRGHTTAVQSSEDRAKGGALGSVPVEQGKGSAWQSDKATEPVDAVYFPLGHWLQPDSGEVAPGAYPKNPRGQGTQPMIDCPVSELNVCCLREGEGGGRRGGVGQAGEGYIGGLAVEHAHSRQWDRGCKQNCC